MSQGKLETEYQIGGITIIALMPHLTFIQLAIHCFEYSLNFLLVHIGSFLSEYHKIYDKKSNLKYWK